MPLTSSDSVAPRCLAISFRAVQNGSSRLMLVLWPPMTIDRLVVGDFMTMTALLIKRAHQTVGAAASSLEEVAGGYLSLPFLGEQFEDALSLVLVSDDLVEQVTEVRDVLTSNKSL